MKHGLALCIIVYTSQVLDFLERSFPVVSVTGFYIHNQCDKGDMGPYTLGNNPIHMFDGGLVCMYVHVCVYIYIF